MNAISSPPSFPTNEHGTRPYTGNIIMYTIYIIYNYILVALQQLPSYKLEASLYCGNTACLEASQVGEGGKDNHVYGRKDYRGS